MKQFSRKLTALILTALICASMMVFFPLPTAYAVTDTAGGSAYAAAAKLFAKDLSFYGRRNIWCSAEMQGNTGTADWCADFVSYVAQKLGVSKSIIPHSAGANAWAKTTQTEFHSLIAQFQTSGNTYDYEAAGRFDPYYEVQIGDIVTFCWKGYKSFCHVGIVTRVDRNKHHFWYISGNTGANSGAERTVKVAGPYSYHKEYSGSSSASVRVIGFFHPQWNKVSSCKTATPVSVVTASINDIALDVGETAQPTLTILPDNAFCKTVVWTSSDTTVATVGKYNGLITAVSDGTAVITARAIADNVTSLTGGAYTAISVTVGTGADQANYTAPYKVIFDAVLPLKSAPSASASNVIPALPFGQSFMGDADSLVSEGGNEWIHAQLSNGTTGYVNISNHRYCIALDELSVSPTAEYEVVYAGSDGLFINKKYNASNTDIATMYQGMHFTAYTNTVIHSGSYDWAYCSCPEAGAEGWTAISDASLCVQVESSTSGGEYIPFRAIMRVKADEADLFSEPTSSSTSEHVVTYMQGDTVHVVGYYIESTGFKLKWCVTDSGLYILSDYLEIVTCLDHIPGEWETVTEPTETAAGLRELHCTVCGELLMSETLPKLTPSALIEYEVVYTGAGIRVRKSPGLSGTQIGLMSNGTHFFVHDGTQVSADDHTWAYVHTADNSLAGYVAISDSSLVRPVSGGSSSTSFTVKGQTTDPESGHIYKLFGGSATWEDARAYCASLGEGWGLACMDGDSDDEQTIIEDLVVSFGKACWLGGHNLTGSWMWISGIPIDVNDPRWDDGEPSGNYNTSTENYLGIYANNTQTSYATARKWNDFQLTSSTPKGFVAEYAPDLPDPLFIQIEAPDNDVICLGEACEFTYDISGGTQPYAAIEYEWNYYVDDEKYTVAGGTLTEASGTISVAASAPDADEMRLFIQVTDAEGDMAAEVSVVSVIDPGQSSYMTYRVIYDAKVALKAGPGSSYDTVRTLSLMEEFRADMNSATENSGTWVQVMGSGGTEGWVNISQSHYVISYADWYASPIDEYEVKYSGGLMINRKYNVTGVSIKTMPKGSHFYVLRDTAVASGNYTWAFGYYGIGANQVFGWVAVSKPEYCVRVTGQDWDGWVELTDNVTGDPITGNTVAAGTQMRAFCNDANVGIVSWEISDTSVIRIKYYLDEDGMCCILEAVAPGTATVTVAGKYVRTFAVTSAAPVAIELTAGGDGIVYAGEAAQFDYAITGGTQPYASVTYDWYYMEDGVSHSIETGTVDETEGELVIALPDYYADVMYLKLRVEDAAGSIAEETCAMPVQYLRPAYMADPYSLYGYVGQEIDIYFSYDFCEIDSVEWRIEPYYGSVVDTVDGEVRDEYHLVITPEETGWYTPTVYLRNFHETVTVELDAIFVLDQPTSQLPAGLKVISQEAFDNCPFLGGTLFIPAGVERIGQNAFRSCDGITAIVILGRDTVIDNGGLNGTICPILCHESCTAGDCLDWQGIGFFPIDDTFELP